MHMNAKTQNKWIELERVLRNAVTDTRSEESKALSEKLHHFQVQNELLSNENNGLRYALTHRKKQKTKGRALDLQQHEEY
jgi:hypothetical protein